MNKSIPKGYKKTEIGIIPEDWEVKSMLQIVEKDGLIRGPFGGSLKKDFFVKKGIKVYEQKNAIYRDIKLGDHYIDNKKYLELKRFEVYPGDFIVSCSGTIGKIFLIPDDAPNGIINQALLIIRIKPSKVDKKYFFYYFDWERFQETIIDNTQGGAMKNLIGMEEFKKTKFAIPNSLSEQTAIARVLSDIDNLIESLDKLIKKKKAIKKGVMQELLTGKKRLPGFKGEWIRKKLGDVIVENPKSHYNVNLSSKNGKYPFFTSGESVYRSDNYLVDGGNLFLATGGVFNLKYYSSKANYSADTYVIKGKNSNTKFLYYILYLLKEIINSKFFEGSGLSHLQKRDFKNLEIAIPPTLKEQTAIAQILSDMDAEIEALEKKKEKYERIKKGAMQLLLTGKIRLIGKETSKKNHSSAFNEAVLISVLADSFSNEKYPLSRFKYTKLSYIFHRFTDNNIENFQKMEAGPYNPRNRYKGPESIAVEKGYIKRIKNRYEGFIVGKDIDEAKRYFSKWYDYKIIDKMKKQFMYKRHEELEAITTIDFVIVQLNKDGKEINVENVIKYLENDKKWKSKLKKEHFSPKKIKEIINFCLNTFDYEVLK